MPDNKTLEAKRHSPRRILAYVVVAAIIVLITYYVPNYSFLEKATAVHTASLLNFLGMSVQTKTIGDSVFLADIRIVKDCTGVQVMAVFLGMLIPLPNAPIRKKFLTLMIVSVFVYAANVLRIALEFWLVDTGVLPWVLAHYPLSLLLGIVGVSVLVLVTNRTMPEFGDFLFYVARRLRT